MADLIADLEYLRENAFEFILTFNPGAGCYDTREDYASDRLGFEREWVSDEQRAEAMETGLIVEGQVYSNGSVSFYQFSGTVVADVVRACAEVCREDRERWAKSQGSFAKTGLQAAPA